MVRTCGVAGRAFSAVVAGSSAALSNTAPARRNAYTLMEGPATEVRENTTRPDGSFTRRVDHTKRERERGTGMQTRRAGDAFDPTLRDADLAVRPKVSVGATACRSQSK